MKLIAVSGMYLFIMALLPNQVFAHSFWKPKSITPPRDKTSSKLKVAPCGGTLGSPPTLLKRTKKPKIFKPGEVINVKWVENIDHVGNYHINLLDGNNTIIKNIVVDYPDPFAPPGTGLDQYNLDITIPTTDNNGQAIPLPCTDCSLQLLQEMWFGDPPARDPNYDPVNFLPSRTFYFSCSDIMIQSTSSIVPGEVTFPATLARINNIDNVILEWVNPDELDNNNINNVAYRVLIVMDTVPITDVPTDGTAYTVGQTIGAGSSKVVYNGNLEKTTITGLTATNDYYFKFFTFNVSNLYSAGIESAAVVIVPVAPIVDMAIRQGIEVNPSEFNRKNGLITASANIINAITGDTFEYDWSRTDNRLTDQTTSKTDEIFQFDPSLLDAGDYTITVAATNTAATSGLTSIDKVVPIKIILPKDGAIKTDPGSGPSGGCSIVTSAKFDPLLLLLSLLSMLIIGFKFIKIK